MSSKEQISSFAIRILWKIVHFNFSFSSPPNMLILPFEHNLSNCSRNLWTGKFFKFFWWGKFTLKGPELTLLLKDWQWIWLISGVFMECFQHLLKYNRVPVMLLQPKQSQRIMWWQCSRIYHTSASGRKLIRLAMVLSWSLFLPVYAILCISSRWFISVPLRLYRFIYPHI